MKSPTRANWKGYLLAVVSVGAVAVIRVGLEQVGQAEDPPFVLFALAVVVASWMGGFGPGLLATVASTFVAEWFFLSPYYSLVIDNRAEYGPLLQFLLQGILISWLGGSNRAALLSLHDVRQELEDRVARRTSELRRANQALLEQMDDNEEAAAALRSYSEQLQRSNKELQEFASVASHDLQEPLRKIQAFGDRLQTKYSGGLDETAQDYLRRMLNAAGRMQVLINDLLAFSRVTTQAQPFAPVRLNQLIDEVVSDLEARFEESGGEISVGDLPEIDADALQMRQLFQNLISNGLKFHRPGVPPRIWIEGRQITDGEPAPGSEPEAVCEIRVSDNGIGFHEKYLDRIFDIFQRLHSRGAYEGTGIGLAVCRKIIDRHRGYITAESREGEGATFVITLPVRQSMEGVIHEQAAEADHNPVGR